VNSGENFHLYQIKRFRLGPPFLESVAIIVFTYRFLAGIVFSYGSPLVAVSSAVLAAVYLVVALRHFFPGDLRKAESSFSKNVLIVPRRIYFFLPALPFVFVSILALLDYAFAEYAIFPWPVILVVAAFFASIFESFVIVAAVSIICGLMAAVGLAGGGMNLGNLFTLISFLPIAALVYMMKRSEARRSYNETEERVEREHALASMRDAEVEIAARIQRALLLDVPSSVCKGLRVEAITVASNAVDGDFYGFVPYTVDSIDVLVGDVMGKGVPAALLGAAIKSTFLRSSLHLLVDTPGMLPKLDDLVSSAHDGLAGGLSNLDSFATLQYARVDSRRSRLDFVDCGHTPILHFDSATNLVWAIKGSNLPLGFTDENTYARYSIPLSEGDRLVFYSDGITEAPSENGELFGDKRLSSIINSNASLAPAELVRRILNTAMYFTSSIGFRDDVTCIVFSIDHSLVPPRRVFTDFPAQSASLGDIRAFFETQLIGTNDKSIDRILLAVSEAASNVIRHGIGLNPSSETKDAGTEDYLDEDGPEEIDEKVFLDENSLRAEFVQSEGWSSVRLIYRGKPFAGHVPAIASDMETLPEGGFGRALMAKAADSVLYASGPQDLQLVCLFFEQAE